MAEKIIVETTQTNVQIVTVGTQGPQGIQGHSGEPGTIDETILNTINEDISSVRALAEINQLKLSQKVEIQDFEITQEQVELNRLAILNKADILALAQLALLVDTKADQAYVQQQIANLVGSAPEALDTIYELASALQNNSGLIEGLNQSVANRVRFDVATQVLTEIQKQNACTNIGAEKLGTAQQLVSQITAQSLGAATSAQGVKADTALQSADVAPVALSGQFSSLSGQNKIFDVVYSAYTEGTNSVITATDSLGTMLKKLQAQIKAGSSPKVEWIDASLVFKANTLNTLITNATINGTVVPLEFAKINGMLWIRGGFTSPTVTMSNTTMYGQLNDEFKIMTYKANMPTDFHQINCAEVNANYSYRMRISSDANLLTSTQVPTVNQGFTLATGNISSRTACVVFGCLGSLVVP